MLARCFGGSPGSSLPLSLCCSARRWKAFAAAYSFPFFLRPSCARRFFVLGPARRLSPAGYTSRNPTTRRSLHFSRVLLRRPPGPRRSSSLPRPAAVLGSLSFFWWLSFLPPGRTAAGSAKRIPPREYKGPSLSPSTGARGGCGEPPTGHRRGIGRAPTERRLPNRRENACRHTARRVVVSLPRSTDGRPRRPGDANCPRWVRGDGLS